MVILENIDIDKAILQNIDIDKISNRFKFGILNRARWDGMGWDGIGWDWIGWDSYHRSYVVKRHLQC